jgi:unsaturated rhamnogalacturonyl hydrolase
MMKIEVRIVIVFLLTSIIMMSCKIGRIISEKDLLRKNLVEVGILLSNDLINAKKYMMYETQHLTAIHYAEVCAAYGVLKYAKTTRNNTLFDQIKMRYDGLTHDTLARQHHHVDGNVYGILPFQLYEAYNDKKYLEHGLFMANSQWEKTLPNGMTSQTRYWLDDVFMVGVLQLEAHRATHEKKYMDRAAYFTARYVDSLQQKNGLFFHGPEAPIHWGRGNGWMAVGLTEIIKELPANHKNYKAIHEGYLKMMSTLLTYQTQNGMWRQVIDHEDAWEESSCTAMFAYALTCGLKKGILKGDKYKIAVSIATKSLINLLDKNGKLPNVCAGTGQSKDIAYYLNRPKNLGDFHGQAPLLWLVDELIEEL